MDLASDEGQPGLIALYGRLRADDLSVGHHSDRLADVVVDLLAESGIDGGCVDTGSATRVPADRIGAVWRAGGCGVDVGVSPPPLSKCASARNPSSC
jgi:hypothetical protein